MEVFVSCRWREEFTVGVWVTQPSVVAKWINESRTLGSCCHSSCLQSYSLFLPRRRCHPWTPRPHTAAAAAPPRSTAAWRWRPDQMRRCWGTRGGSGCHQPSALLVQKTGAKQHDGKTQLFFCFKFSVQSRQISLTWWNDEIQSTEARWGNAVEGLWDS